MIFDISKHNKYWFTLAEMLLVCSVFAIMIAGIILWINRAYVFMNNSKLQTLSTNLTREWVEMMFNIRDTNWRKSSWNKDTNRLSLGTWNEMFEKWIYALKEWKWQSWDSHVYAELLTDKKLDTIYSSEWFWNSNIITWSKITFSGEYKYLSGTNVITWSVSSLLLNESEFYRIVRVFDVKNKISSCSESCPKEMLFCVKVFYRNNGNPHSTELCSIMTNFAK